MKQTGCIFPKQWGTRLVANFIFFALFLIVSSVFSGEIDLMSSKEKDKSPTSQNASDKKEEKISGIRGIFLTGKAENIIPEGRPNVRGVEILDVEIPGDPKALKAILEPYLGKKLTIETATEIKGKILLYYKSQQRPFVGVELPQQKTTSRVLQVLISKKQFGKPIYKGEMWYSDEQMNRYLGITPHQEIVEDTLQNNLSWMNRNPFHYSQSKFVPGEEAGVVDLEISTKTRRAVRVYGRADNTGSASTGYERFSTGFSWGNALWLGDLLTFEYTCSNDFAKYQSYMGNYTSFLPWKHIFMLFGNYATVKPVIPIAPNTPPPTISSTAHSTQVYAHYTIPFKPLYKPSKQQIIFGFEYKNTNSNTVSLSDGVVETQDIGRPTNTLLNISQFYGNYTFSSKMPTHDIAFSLDLYGSPGAMLPHQSNATFNTLRPNSHNYYFYSYLTFANTWTIPKTMSISLLFRGQISNDTLPSTELFNLGGYNTIRGYHEAELSTDNGFMANLELRSLPLNLWRAAGDQLVFLFFIDYGIGNNWFVQSTASTPKPPSTQYLLGTGPGLRYTINPYLQVRADYGFKLHQLFTSNKSEEQLRLGFGQFHLGLLLSY